MPSPRAASRHPCRLPLRGLSTPTHRRTGAPVEQRAIPARTRYATAARLREPAALGVGWVPCLGRVPSTPSPPAFSPRLPPARPTAKPFCSSRRAICSALRPFCSGHRVFARPSAHPSSRPRAFCSTGRAFCSAVRSPELGTPSFLLDRPGFLLGPPSYFLGRLGSLLGLPS
jgi:hypothetical protein